MGPFNKILLTGSVPTRPDTRDSASEPGVFPEFGTRLIYSPFLVRKGNRGMVETVVKHCQFLPPHRGEEVILVGIFEGMVTFRSLKVNDILVC